MRRTQLSLLALEDRWNPVLLPDGFAFSLVTGGLSAPTAMTEMPDGRVLISEQQGALRVVSASGVLLPTPAIKLEVNSIIERGLLGVVPDPNFVENGYVYLYYTVPETPTSPVHNRVSRFTMVGDILDPSSEFVLLNLDPLGHGAHNGGALRFGTDGKLYIAVGDNVVPENAQLGTNYFGKILRINPDGTIPEDNPATIDGIAEPTQGVYRAIYAAGLRNPFTFDIDPITGAIYVNDVGQDAVEEVNELAPGRNFGWSLTEGPFDPTLYPNFTQPIISYIHFPALNDTGYAVTGGSFYRPDIQTFPEQYTGDYFYNDFVNGWIRAYDVETGTNSLFASRLNGFSVLGLQTSMDGSLLVLAYGNGQPSTGALYRIQYTDEPKITSHPQSAIRLPRQSVTFQVEANSTLPLTYQWQRNGEDIPDATEPTYTLDNIDLDDNGAVFRVVVSNTTGSVTSNSATLRVSNDLPPLVSIVTPVQGTKFAYGQTIEFSGVALDVEDGELPPSELSWRIDYITGDAAPRPFFPETSGISGGTVLLPTSSPFTRTDVLYRYVLTAKDSFGNVVIATRDITPIVGTATLTSDVPGTILYLDGTPHVSGYILEGVVGQQRTLTAPPSVTIGGVQYPFINWSDGETSNPRTISVAQDGVNFQANYLSTVPQQFAPAPIVVGSATTGLARTFDAVSGDIIATFNVGTLTLPSGTSISDVRVARGDVNGDGIAEIIVGAGPGSEPYVLIYDGVTRDLIASFLAFESTFTGGVFVAAADFDNDGRADVVVSPDQGGGPRVVIFSSGDPNLKLADFYGIDDPDFRGGARIAVGDVSGNGRPDLVVAAGFLGGPRVAAFNGTTLASGTPIKLFNDFFAFEETLRNGVFVAVGDLDGDGRAEIVAGGGPGGGPRVTAFNGSTLIAMNVLNPIANFFAGDETNRNGVRLGVTDPDGDGIVDLLVGTPEGVRGEVLRYTATEMLTVDLPQPSQRIDPFGEDFSGGIFVG